MLPQQFDVPLSDFAAQMAGSLQNSHQDRRALIRKGDGDQLRGAVLKVDVPVEVGQIHADAECVAAANHGHLGRPIAHMHATVQGLIEYGFFREIDWIGGSIIGHIGVMLQLLQGQLRLAAQGMLPAQKYQKQNARRFCRKANGS